MPSPPARSASAGSPTSSSRSRPARSAHARVELENAGAATWHEVIAVVPLARRSRQPDPLGRPAHAATGARPRRAVDRRARRPRRSCPPAGTASPSTSCSSTATGSRRSATSCSRSTIEVDRTRRLRRRRAPPAGGRARSRLARARPRRARGGLRRGRRRDREPSTRAARLPPRRGAQPVVPGAARLPVAPAAARAELRGRRAPRLAARGLGALDLRRADRRPTR